MCCYRNLFTVILFTFISSILFGQNSELQYDKFGDYTIPRLSDWQFVQEKSHEKYFVFQYKSGEVEIGINKETQQCTNDQEFNSRILALINGLSAKKEYSEQRRQSAPIAFLGLTSSHLISIKSRDTGKRRFLYHPLKGNQMYEISVIEKAQVSSPGDQAVQFLSLIYMSSEPDGKANSAIAAEKLKKLRPTDIVVRPDTKVKQKDAKMDDYKRVKTQDVVEESNVEEVTNIKDDKNKTIETGKEVYGEKGFIESLTLNLKMPEIKKPTFSEVKFKYTDPCANTQEKETPWEPKQKNSAQASGKGDELFLPILPDFKNLSIATYRSAVGAVFENLRLVYGPMEEEEYKQFQSLWNPIFDYPTEEIVDYLNQLNHHLFKYLTTREAYLRIAGEYQMLLFDAAMAVEIQDRQAWDATTAELARYADLLTTSENNSKVIAEQIEALGNPPNPNMEKCKAQQRYKRMMTVEGPEGCWAGYMDDLFLSDGKYSFTKTDIPTEEVLGLVHHPKYEYIYKVTTNGVEKFYSIAICIDCNIGATDYKGNCSNGSYGDKFIRENFFGKESYTGLWIDGPRKGEESQYVEKFDFPDIPEFPEVSELQIQKWIELDAEHNRSFWADALQKMLRKHAIAPVFYETAIRWTKENRWQQYRYNDETWMPPDDLLIAFANEMQSSMPEKEKSVIVNNPPETTKQNSTPEQKTEKNKDKTVNTSADDEALLEQTVNFHKEMVAIIEHNLQRDLEDRTKEYEQLRKAKNEQEAKDIYERIKQFDLRIIHHQSNMQAETDLIASHQTGQIVRTRTVFDDYASQRFIESIRENAARMDATRRIADRIDRQINLLPEEEREKARKLAREVLDPKTVGSGDLEKAKNLVNAFNNKIQGYGSYDQASAQLDEIDTDATEYYGSLAIAAVGAGAIGFGSAVLANTYGAQAAMTVYGTKLLSAVYGGTTGLVLGGPDKGIKDAIAYWSPLTYAAQEFVHGYRGKATDPSKSESEKIWNGVIQGGSAFVLGKAFEYGVAFASKGAMIVVGKESWLAQPLIGKGSTQLSKTLRDKVAQQRKTTAKDNIEMFKKWELELAQLKRNAVANKAQIDRLEKNLQDLAAEINLSFDAKWMMKYQVHPTVRGKYDQRAKKNIEQVKPGLTRRMQEKGYIMDDIEFVHFRNGNSGGSSSMDFDLVPVNKRTGKEVKVFRKKDGTFETSKEFNKDAQNALDDEYFALYKMNARASDIQITTSAHAEAFANAKMLNHNVNFSSFTPEEVASVGKVLEVKVANIDRNKMLSTTSKMQARAREAAKEVENMLLRKLKSELKNLKPGSSEYKNKQKDIEYWENMLERLNTIGKQETDPMKLVNLNRELIRETGGRDVNGVIDDIISTFKKM